ncbi:hypothetical protein OG754_40420 (plasmid) [Streptomyces decoyicus]|uniref:hypothetical protein n=1 Tax=Streptomyces decoyicus TaxID=249567 RepID=UPI002E30DCE1|nr:hypothetical protein [Streptomyces decoyicus]
MDVEPAEPTAFLNSAEGETKRERSHLLGDGYVGTGGYGFPGPAVTEVVITAVGTAAVLPFMQALATQAGNSAFEAARRLVARWVRDPGSGTPPVVDEGESLRVIDEGDGRLTFEVPSGLPDEALEALTRVNLEALAAPSRDAEKVLIRWDPEGREWRRVTI